MTAPVVTSRRQAGAKVIDRVRLQEVNRLEAESQRHASVGGEAEKRNYRRPPEGEKKPKKKTDNIVQV